MISDYVRSGDRSCVVGKQESRNLSDFIDACIVSGCMYGPESCLQVRVLPHCFRDSFGMGEARTQGVHADAIGPETQLMARVMAAIPPFVAAYISWPGLLAIA